MDKTLFIRKHDNDVIFVQVYVDDIIFGSNNNTFFEELVAAMQGEYDRWRLFSLVLACLENMLALTFLDLGMCWMRTCSKAGWTTFRTK